MPGIIRCFLCNDKDTCGDSMAVGLKTEEEVEVKNRANRKARGFKDEDTLVDQIAFIEEQTGEKVIDFGEIWSKDDDALVGFATKSYRGNMNYIGISNVSFMPRDVICICPVHRTGNMHDEDTWTNLGPGGMLSGNLEEVMFEYVSRMREKGKFKKADRVRSPDNYGSGIDPCAAVFFNDNRAVVPSKPAVMSKSLWKHIKEEKK